MILSVPLMQGCAQQELTMQYVAWLGLPFLQPKNCSDGTDGSFVGILPVSQKRKTSEFRSEPFLEEKYPWNSVLNHFLEEKNPWSSIRNHFWMRKTSEFSSEPFSEEKNLGIRFRNIFGIEKTSKFRSQSFSEEKNFRNRRLLLTAL
jgi:hypothetical protein